MSANDIRYGRRGGHEVEAGRVLGRGRCIECKTTNPEGRYLYCSDECSVTSRQRQTGRRAAAA